MVIGIIMNGNHQNGHKISEESIKYHSIRPLRPNLIGSINISASFHESETKQKASSRSKSSLLDLSEMKKRPDFLNHLYTAIQIEKNLKLGVTYELNFSIRYETCFGERIVIAGTPEFLGNWNPLKGLELEWTTGNVWKANILIGEGVLKDFEYKFVCIKCNGIEWEKGENRLLKVSDGLENGSNILFKNTSMWQS